MKRRTSLAIVYVTLVGVLSAHADTGTAATQSALKSGPASVLTSGLSLVVRFGDNSAEVLAARTAHTSRSTHPTGTPVLDLSTWNRFPPGTKELLACVYDQQGRRLGVFGWPSSALVFSDQPGRGSKGPLRGRSFVPHEDQRIVYIPIERDAHFLAFFRTEVLAAHSPGAKDDDSRTGGAKRPSGKSPLRISILSIYTFLPDSEDGTRPTPTVSREFDAPIPGLPPLTVSSANIVALDVTGTDTEDKCASASNPEPKHATVIVEECDPLLECCAGAKECFDVVILGDGFTQGANNCQNYSGCNPRINFLNWADQVEYALVGGEAGDMADCHPCLPTNTTATAQSEPVLPPDEPGIKPFADFRKRIRFHKVWTKSTNSGVTNCWNDDETACDAEPRVTYYGVRGEGKDLLGTVGGPGFFDTEKLDCVKQVVDTSVAAWEDIELVIMLVNCQRFGGNGDLTNKLAYIPLWCGDGFAGLVAHEAAHAIARLGEEYVSCIPPDALGTWRFANIATRDDLQTGRVFWTPLAERMGTYAGGAWTVLHDSDGPGAYNCDCEPFGDEEEWKRSKLGLFWGALYGSCQWPPEQTACPQSGTCTTSRYHFRPMNSCRMRDKRAEFCDVCRCALTNAIYEASGGRSDSEKKNDPCATLPSLPPIGSLP